MNQRLINGQQQCFRSAADLRGDAMLLRRQRAKAAKLLPVVIAKLGQLRHVRSNPPRLILVSSLAADRGSLKCT